MIIIGEAPSRRGDPERPLSAEPIRSRLIELFGAEAYLAAEKTNLLPANPGPKAVGKGDALPATDARTGALLLFDACRRARLAVFLGKRVARAFRVAGAPYLARMRHIEGFDFFVVPHPSGINHWWNQPGHRTLAKVKCRELSA